MGCSCWLTFFKQKFLYGFKEKKICRLFQNGFIDNLKFAVVLSWR